jgi:hypothetical protein
MTETVGCITSGKIDLILHNFSSQVNRSLIPLAMICCGGEGIIGEALVKARSDYHL